PVSEVLCWRRLVFFFFFSFFFACVATLGWGLAVGSLGWVSLHGLSTSARRAASGGKATGNGQGDRGWLAELAVHGGNGWWRKRSTY
ncbi:hypothetical protein CORC01_12611, partial [Colletotrichum orchidophilum]